MEDNAQPPADAGASALTERSVGEMLNAARAAQALTLEQVATELRIEVKQLEALEADRFDRIGVPVFVKGYLRQYGQRLGLDHRDLLAQYYKQTSLKEVQIQPSRTIKLHDERQITVWVIAALALLVVIAGLAAWWLNGGGFDIGRAPAPQPKSDGAKPAATVPAPAEPAAATPAATSTPSAAGPTGATGGAANGGETAAPSQPATTPAEPTTARSVPARPTAGATSVTTPPATTPPVTTLAATTPSTTTPAAVDSQAASPALTVPLVLTFEQDSWAEVSDARGTRLYYDLGTAGRRAELRGEPPFAVVLGNASGVKIVVDGADFNVPTKGRPGEYARFSVGKAAN